MEEQQTQKECQAKKCCAKGIIIVIVCSLVCFFLGYYAGSKSLATVSKAAVNKPFNPSGIPRIPNPGQVNALKSLPRKNNLPNMQRPPVPNIQRPPKIQTPPPKINVPKEVPEQAKSQSEAESKK